MMGFRPSHTCLRRRIGPFRQAVCLSVICLLFGAILECVFSESLNGTLWSGTGIRVRPLNGPRTAPRPLSPLCVEVEFALMSV